MIKISGNARIAAVIGDPIGHTLSPTLHNYWYEKLGIDGVYIPLRVNSTDLASTLSTLQKCGFRGTNVTLPHKIAASRLVDELSQAAKIVGAVNTIMFRSDGSRYGTNTDGEGFRRNLMSSAPDFDLANASVTVLGAGGAARAIVAELLMAGSSEISIINRNVDRATALVEYLSNNGYPGKIRAISWQDRHRAASCSDLLINTTSAGMLGERALAFDVSACRSDCVVADIVYNPLETALLADARRAGMRTVDGLGMLIHQAVPGFAHWGGIEPEVNDELIAMMVNQLNG